LSSEETRGPSEKCGFFFSKYNKYLIKVFILDILSKNFYGLYHYCFQLWSHCIWI